MEGCAAAPLTGSGRFSRRDDGISAQTKPRPRFDAFEVATIKPADPDGGRCIRMQSAGRLQAHNHALRTLIAAAYDLSPQAISGGPLGRFRAVGNSSKNA